MDMAEEKKIYIITSRVEAGTPETLPVSQEMVLLRNEDLMNSGFHFAKEVKVCITSEYSLSAITGRLDPDRENAVKVLKDKFRFRELLREIFPDYSFRIVETADISTLVVDRKSVIKPRRGIFGTAVRIVGPETNFNILAAELSEEIRKNAAIYPDSVLSGGEFILEEFVGGEEYAVDMFYDSSGNPCIVNIMHHPLPANDAYLHMIYNSSKAAFDAIYHHAKDFFRKLNTSLQVTNFAMHAELRHNNGTIFPVEINSMRFGGMGLCNLVWFSHDINPFLCFLHDREPDWDSLWKGKEKQVYSFFIAYNGIGSPTDHSRPDRNKLKKQFTKVIREVPFDHKKQLAFGVYFLEETKENIEALLKIEFDDFFEPSTESETEKVKFSALILASGLSERMGYSKALLMWDESTSFLEKLIGEYLEAGCTQVVCTLNEQVYPYFKHLENLSGVTIVLNLHPELGRMYSVKLGLDALKDSQYCLLQNVDSPFINRNVIGEILESADPDAWSSPEHKGKGGHPVILPHKIIDQILQANNKDLTLREVLDSFPKKVVNVADDSILKNINTPEDYRDFLAS
jgi:CTP:molybdopterin cytidylyltransferase MocA